MSENTKKCVLKVAHINARSILAGFNEFSTTIRLHDFDVVGVTETWLTSDISNDQIKIQNYDCYRCDRSTRGGGVALFVKSCYQCSVIMSGQLPNLEYIWIKIQSRSVTESISMFDDMLALILPEYNDIVLTGDINIDLLKTNNAVSQCFDAYGLTQVITDPTRVTETTATLIDSLYLKKPDTCLRSGVINADLFSDHGLVFCELSFDHVKTRQKYITFRDFTKFDQETFDNDLYSIPCHEIIYMKNIEDKVKFITSNITNLNIHCPLKTARKQGPSTVAYEQSQAERDNALLKYKRERTANAWNAYKALRNYALTLVRNEKSAYLKHVRSQNSRQFYSSLKSLNVISQRDDNIPDKLSNPYAINDAFMTAQLEYCFE
nr:unnamed protein product [Callosobruchus analis]